MNIRPRIACIGSREAPPSVLSLMERAGAAIVRAGCILSSGNAPGSDQAWARGGNRIDPTRVELHLPWYTFERRMIRDGNKVRVLAQPDTADRRYFDIAETVHGRWRSLSDGAHRLHARNVMIVENTIAVIGWSNPNKSWGGGTGGAFRIAKFLHVPVFDAWKIDGFLPRLIYDLEALVCA